MAQKHPDRAVFWGSVNPLEGKKALDLMTRQVEDYGAKAFKFYNVRYDYGQPFPWRMDDPRIAYPVFERAQELGVNLIGVHKGVPLGPQPIEHTRTFDMDGAAANFPDINFVIFHVGLPWLDEVLWQIVRYPNLYASIAATVNFIARQPRVFAETLGKMLWWCGEDKIIYGGESPIWHPQWALEEFWNFELPRDIVEERGYPQLTDQAKRKILGENMAQAARDRRRGQEGGARHHGLRTSGAPAQRKRARRSAYAAAATGSGRTTTVSATGTISSAPITEAAAWARMRLGALGLVDAERAELAARLRDDVAADPADAGAGLVALGRRALGGGLEVVGGGPGVAALDDVELHWVSPSGPGRPVFGCAPNATGAARRRASAG